MTFYPIRGNVTLHPLRGNVTLHPLRGNVTLHPLHGNVTLHPLRGNVTLHPLRVSERGISASVGGSRFMLVWNPWFWEAFAEIFVCTAWFCSGTKTEPKRNQDGTKTEPQSSLV